MIICWLQHFRSHMNRTLQKLVHVSYVITRFLLFYDITELREFHDYGSICHFLITNNYNTKRWCVFLKSTEETVDNVRTISLQSTTFPAESTFIIKSTLIPSTSYLSSDVSFPTNIQWKSAQFVQQLPLYIVFDCSALYWTRIMLFTW